MTGPDDFEQRFKGLVSDHVDAQLGEHRNPPTFRPSDARVEHGIVDLAARRRRPWMLPLLAAACVALVVGGTAGAVNLLSDNTPAPASTDRPTIVDPTRSTAGPTPTGRATRPTNAASSTTTSGTTAKSTPTVSRSRSTSGSASSSRTSNPNSSTATTASPAVVTRRIVVRPVHADGTPVAGYAVHNETGDGSICTDLSLVAVDPNIRSCGSSAQNTLACWKSTGATVLCLRDPTKKVLVRIRESWAKRAEAALGPIAPQIMTLGSDAQCTIRSGGTGNSPQEHPSWAIYYYCGSTKAVYGPRDDDGIDETVSPWTVVVFPLSGKGSGQNLRVRAAYFVGTAS